MTILSDIQGFLIRATHHQKMTSMTLRDLSMETAVPTATSKESFLKSLHANHYLKNNVFLAAVKTSLKFGV